MFDEIYVVHLYYMGLISNFKDFVFWNSKRIKQNLVF